MRPVDEFDVNIGELLAVSRAIGRRVAHGVGVTVTDTAEIRIDRGEVSAMLIENAARSRMIRHLSAEALHRNIRDQQVALDRYPEAAWGNFGQALALRTGIDNGWLRTDVDAASVRAEDLVARALALAPQNYLSHFALGKTLAGKGETTRAILAFEHAAALNPSSTMVLAGLIGPVLNTGDTERALELIEMSERISPLGDRNISYQKAKTYWRMGAPDAALRALMSVPDLTIDQAKLLAVVQLDLGDLEKARAALKPFLAANPDWSLRVETEVQRATGTPPDLFEPWLSRLSAAGMPH